MIKRSVVVLIAITLLLFNVPSGIAQSTEPEITLHHSWGGEGNVLNQGSDLRLTDEGHILVVNGHYNRITRIIPGEETFQNFGGYGYGDGQLANAMGITTGPDGTIYVAGYGTIKVFSKAGEYLRTIWSFDEETGYWDSIYDVAIDADGIIHAIAVYGDSSSIKSFTADGTQIRKWSTPTGSDTPLLNPIKIEVTPDNKLIISEFGDNFDRYGRIVICDTLGNFEKAIGQLGESDHLEKPVDVAINPLNGNIFVSDIQRPRIYEFSPDMEILLNQWGSFGDAPGQLFYPRSIEFDKQGNLLVLSGERNIQVFTPEGDYIRSYGIPADAPGQFMNPFDILVSQSEIVYVADSNHQRIQAFDLNGNYMFDWKINHGWARGLSEDSDGNIYVTQSDSICKYSNVGELQLCWGEHGTEPGQFMDVQDVIVQTVTLPSGTKELVYTVDNVSRIQIFMPDGTYLSGFPVEDCATRLVVDASGAIFAKSNAGGALYKFTPEGEKIATYDWGGAIEFGSDGYFYLADAEVKRIYRVNPEDMSIEKTWVGEYGDINNLYIYVSDAFDFSMEGLLYFVDPLDARVLVFELKDNEAIQSEKSSVLQTSIVTSEINLIQNGGFENELNSATWTFYGALPSQRSNEAHTGNYSLQLGELSHSGQDYAQAYTTITIPEGFAFPELSFYYQVQSNDPIDLADLYVEIQDGVGLNHLTKVVQVGPETSNIQGDWKHATVSLNAYRGKTIRLSFISRNRIAASSGIFALIDDVQITSNAKYVFLPLIRH